MATQATPYDGFEAAAGPWVAEPQSARREEPDPHRLRPLPNEDIYLYRKAIDNSRVVRQADPRARAQCRRWIATAGAGALLAFALLWQATYSRLAGYQIESLREQQQRLLAERSTLEVEEARLMSPERLEILARNQKFLDPAPEQVVFLQPKADGSLARNLASK
jgi:hypothetical protein